MAKLNRSDNMKWRVRRCEDCHRRQVPSRPSNQDQVNRGLLWRCRWCGHENTKTPAVWSGEYIPDELEK